MRSFKRTREIRDMYADLLVRLRVFYSWPEDSLLLLQKVRKEIVDAG